MKNHPQKHEVPLNILLISSDTLILNIFKKVFRKYGHRITEISHPAEAINIVKAKEKEDPFDILFIDYDKYQDLDHNAFCSSIKKINDKLVIANLGSAFIYKVKQMLDTFGK